MTHPQSQLCWGCHAGPSLPALPYAHHTQSQSHPVVHLLCHCTFCSPLVTDVTHIELMYFPHPFYKSDNHSPFTAHSRYHFLSFFHIRPGPIDSIPIFHLWNFSVASDWLSATSTRSSASSSFQGRPVPKSLDSTLSRVLPYILS